jgi:hypothetical protein
MRPGIIGSTMGPDVELDSCALHTDLFDRYAGRLEMAANERERTVSLVGRFLGDVEQGGLTGFLYNIGPDASSSRRRWSELRETVEALKRIGAAKTADVLAPLIPVLEAPSSASTWGVVLEEKGLDAERDPQRLEEPPEVWSRLDDFLGRSR